MASTVNSKNRLGRAVRSFWSILKNKRPEPGRLREFVYLDETSVESLLASLDGEILTGITESRSKGYELAIAATGDAVGVPTGFSPSVRRSRSVTVAEQRKSVAQSAFARLRSRHFASLRIQASDAQDLHSDPKGLDPSRDVATASLRRGDLIEVDVMLGASDVFQVKAVIKSMIGVVEAFPAQLNGPELAPIREAEPIVAILDSLSQGLIPIEGEVIGFRIVEIDNLSWIVPEDVAVALEASGVQSSALRIAGVSLEPLYWQDVRRVLFSDLKFRVMGRLVHDSTRNSWSSVKLSDVLSRVNTGLADTIDKLGASFLTSLQAGAKRNLSSIDLDLAAERVSQLARFARAVAAEAEIEWTEADEVALGRRASETTDPSLTLERWRDLLRDVSDELLGRSITSIDPKALLKLRSDHALPASTDSSGPQLKPPAYLEIEVIAIYW